MGVDLGKGDGARRRQHTDESSPGPTRGGTSLARTTPPPVAYVKRAPAAPPAPAPEPGPDSTSGLNPHLLGLVNAAWLAAWIICFSVGWTAVALALMFTQGAAMGYLKHQGVPWAGHSAERRARRLERHRRRALARTPQAPPAPPELPDPITTAERALAAAVVRAETSAGRMDAGSVDLVREVDRLLRPLLAQVRTRQADPQVRHDLETLAAEHLPRTVEDYLVLPDDYAHEHRGPSGTTPADELRAQLQLLVEGCKQLRDAVLAADVDRQQQQSRFLEAKFRRSDLDL